MPLVPQQDSNNDWLKQERPEDVQARLRARLAKEQQDAAMTVMDKASEGMDSSLAARVFRIAERTGIDKNILVNNLDELENLDKEGTDWGYFRKHSPRLYKWLSESPQHIALFRKDVNPLADLEKAFARIDDPNRRLSDEEVREQALAASRRRGEKWKTDFNFPSGYGGSVTRRYNSQEEAEAGYYNEELNKRTTVEEIIGGEGKIGFKEQASIEFLRNPLSSVPFWGQTLGLQDTIANVSARYALSSGNMTEEQRDYIVNSVRLDNALKRREGGVSGMVASGLVKAPAFLGEFALTGPVFAGAKALGLRGAKAGAESLARKGLAFTLGGVAQAQAMMPFTIAGETVSGMAPVVDISPSEEGLLQPIVSAQGDGFLEAFYKAEGRAVVEAISERSGIAAEKLTGPLKKFVILRWLKLHPDEGVAGIVGRVTSSVGWNGPIGEMFEERVGEAARAAIGVEEFKPPTKDQLIAEFLTFAGIGAIPGGIEASTYRRVQANQRIAANMAVNHEAALNQTAEVIAKTESFKTAPEWLIKVREEQLKGTGLETVYIEVDPAVEYLTNKGVDPSGFFESLTGSTKAYSEASTTRLVEVPRSRYEVIASTGEHGKFLNSISRFTPDGYSAVSGKAALEELPEVPIVSDEQAIAKASEEQERRKGYNERLNKEGLVDIPELLPDAVESVKEAQVSAELLPLFEDAVGSGMTEKQAKEYAEFAKKVNVEGEGNFLEDQLEVQARIASLDWKVKRRVERKRAEEAVKANKSIIVLEHLHNNRFVDGSSVPDDMRVKLNKEAAIEALGEKVVNLLPDSMFDKKVGVSVNAAAEAFDMPMAEFVDALTRPYVGTAEPNAKEAEIRKLIAKLQEKRVELESRKEPVDAERKALTKDAIAGKAGIAERIGRLLVEDERRSNDDFKALLAEIKELGGIVFDTKPAPKGFPKEYTSKGNNAAGFPEGIPFQELADEFAGRGIIESNTYDAICDFVTTAIMSVKASKGKEKPLIDRAKVLGLSKLRSTLGELEDNAAAMARLRDEIAATREEIRGETLEARRERRTHKREALKVYRESVIEQATDEAMRSKYGAEATEADALNKAVEAVHGAAPLKLMRYELDYMLSEQFGKFMKLSERIISPVKSDAELNEEAKRLLGDKNYMNLNPAVYLQAERDEGRKSKKLFKKGDIRGAVAAKHLQMLNHALFVTASRGRKSFDEGYGYLKKFNTVDVRQKIGKAGEDFLDQIDGILDKVEVRRLSAAKVQRMINLREWLEAEQAKDPSFAPPVPMDLLDDAYRKNIKELTLDELMGVVGSVAALEHRAYVQNRLLASEHAKTLEETQDLLISEGGKYAKEKGRTFSKDSAFKRFFQYVGYSHSSLHHTFRMFDGFKDNGPWWEFFSRSFNAAGNSEATMKAAAADKLDSIFGAYSKMELIKMCSEKFGGKVIPEFNNSLMTREQLICIAANWGNLDSRQKTVEGIATWLKRPLDEAAIKAVLDRELEPRDWKTVQAMWDLAESYWPAIESLGKRIWGLAPEKVEASAFSTPYGEMRGGYYPLSYDPTKVGTVEAAESPGDQVKKMMEGFFFKTQTKHGHMEERKKGVNRVINMSFGVFTQHLSEVIHNLTHFEALADAVRILKSNKIEAFIKDYYGDIAYSHIFKHINNIATGGTDRQDALETFLGYMRRGTTLSMLGFKVSTALIQPLGLTVSGARIGYGRVAKAALQLTGNASEVMATVEWIQNRSAFMKNRSRTYMRDVNDIRQKLSVLGGGLSKYKAAAIFLSAKSQQIADTVTWLAAYEKALDELPTPSDVEGIGSREQKAVDLADQSVIDSQGGGQVKDLAMIQQGHESLRLFTMFFNYFLRRNEVFMQSVSKLDVKSPSSWAKLLTDFLVMYPLPVVIAFYMRLLLRGQGDDKDKDVTLKLYKEVAADLLSGFILARELPSALAYPPYRGPAGLSWLINTGDFLVQTNQAVQDGETDEAFWRSLVKTGGAYLHLPSAQFDATARGLMYLDKRNVNVGAVLVGPPKKKK